MARAMSLRSSTSGSASSITRIRAATHRRTSPAAFQWLRRRSDQADVSSSQCWRITTDQLRPEHRHPLHRRPRPAGRRQVVVRLPELEHQLDLPPRPVEDDDLLPGQQLLAGSWSRRSSSRTRPAAPARAPCRASAPSRKPSAAAAPPPPAAPAATISRQGRRSAAPSRTGPSMGPLPSLPPHVLQQVQRPPVGGRRRRSPAATARSNSAPAGPTSGIAAG